MIMTCLKYLEDTKETKYNSTFSIYSSFSDSQLHLSFCKFKKLHIKVLSSEQTWQDATSNTVISQFFWWSLKFIGFLHGYQQLRLIWRTMIEKLTFFAVIKSIKGSWPCWWNWPSYFFILDVWEYQVQCWPCVCCWLKHGLSFPPKYNFLFFQCLACWYRPGHLCWSHPTQ